MRVFNKTNHIKIMKKIITILSILAATGTLFAQDAASPADSSSWKNGALGVEFAYGLANSDLIPGKSADLRGLNLRYTVPGFINLESKQWSNETYLMAGVAEGDTEFSDAVGKTEISLNVFQLAIGTDLRFAVTDAFSLSAGVRLGLAYLNLENEYDQYGTHVEYQSSWDKVGLLYGAGVGAQYKFNEKHSANVGINYVGTTAKPGDIDAQIYFMFSVGYAYQF